MIKLETNAKDIAMSFQNYSKKLETKIEDELLDLAIAGQDVAKEKFANAIYDGTNDVNVYSDVTGKNQLEIVAKGDSVCFIEFGAGIHYKSNYLGTKPSGISEIGTYGSGKGSNDEWLYPIEKGLGTNGVPYMDKWAITKGNPPNMAMYYASKEIKEKARKIKW